SKTISTSSSLRWTEMPANRDEEELAHGLWRAKAERDAGYLIEVLRRYPDNSTLAIRWLAGWGETTAVPELIRLLTAPRVETRRAAAHALADLGPQPAARAALETMATDDPDPGASSWAFQRWASIGIPSYYRSWSALFTTAIGESVTVLPSRSAGWAIPRRSRRSELH